MKLKEWFYMIGLKPKIKSFGFDIVKIEINKNQTFQWALWKNPKNHNSLPRIKDYSVLKLFLESGDFAIDLGAHVGDTTFSMGLCVGKKGLVLALEPNPATYRILKANSMLNQDKTNIVPLNLAAMDHDGSYVFQYNEPSLMNGGYQKGISRFKHASFFNVNVEGVNLANILNRDYRENLNNLKFIKTDLEGSDFSVFLTIKDIIKKHMPVIQSEINGIMSNSTRRKYIQTLKELNYIVFSLKSDTLDSLQELTQKIIDSDKTFDIVAIPPSMIDNFKELNISLTG
jgi:FkbM family methyltransferase